MTKPVILRYKPGPRSTFVEKVLDTLAAANGDKAILEQQDRALQQQELARGITRPLDVFTVVTVPYEAR